MAGGIHPMAGGIHPMAGGIHPMADGIHPILDGIQVSMAHMNAIRRRMSSTIGGVTAPDTHPDT